MKKLEKTNLVRPRPQESFNKFQRRCPVHIKARCGRAFCNHPIREGKTNVRCTKLTCPFYPESEMLMGKSKKLKSEYRVPRRYRSIVE